MEQKFFKKILEFKLKHLHWLEAKQSLHVNHRLYSNHEMFDYNGCTECIERILSLLSGQELSPRLVDKISLVCQKYWLLACLKLSKVSFSARAMKQGKLVLDTCLTDGIISAFGMSEMYEEVVHWKECCADFSSVTQSRPWIAEEPRFPRLIYIFHAMIKVLVT